MKWNTSLYDDKHAFVTRYGAGVLELLSPQPGETILDVGCGTGHLTQQLALAGAIPTGIDSSSDMIESARRAYPDIEFVQADAANFSFDRKFDALFSNAALHWVQRADDAAACMARVLRPGGRFVVEFGGRGNVRQIDTALRNAVAEVAGVESQPANFFPSIAEYATILERHGIEVIQAHLFERPSRLEDGEQGLANWIRMFRSPTLAPLPDDTQREVVDRVAEQLRPKLFRDGAWFADYRRLSPAPAGRAQSAGRIARLIHQPLGAGPRADGDLTVVPGRERVSADGHAAEPSERTKQPLDKHLIPRRVPFRRRNVLRIQQLDQLRACRSRRLPGPDAIGQGKRECRQDYVPIAFPDFLLRLEVLGTVTTFEIVRRTPPSKPVNPCDEFLAGTQKLTMQQLHG